MSLVCTCSCIQLCVGPHTLKSPGTELTELVYLMTFDFCKPPQLLEANPHSQPSVHKDILNLYLPHHDYCIKYYLFPSRLLKLNSTGNEGGRGGGGGGGAGRASYHSELFISIS